MYVRAIFVESFLIRSELRVHLNVLRILLSSEFIPKAISKDIIKIEPVPQSPSPPLPPVLFADCPEGSALWAKDGECYKLHSRGPCGVNNVFEPRGRSAHCEYNSCKEELQRKDQTTQKCYQLATQGPCGLGEWWVLNDKRPDLGPVCRRRPCKPFQGFLNGRCYELTDNPCPAGNHIHNNVYGKAT